MREKEGEREKERERKRERERARDKEREREKDRERGNKERSDLICRLTVRYFSTVFVFYYLQTVYNYK